MWLFVLRLRKLGTNFIIMQCKMQIWIPTNPRGAERLAPGIIESQSDLYPRRLWGSPDKVSSIIIIIIIFIQ